MLRRSLRIDYEYSHHSFLPSQVTVRVTLLGVKKASEPTDETSTKLMRSLSFFAKKSEMARVMKSSARLAVGTFVKGDNFVLKKFYARMPSSPFSTQEAREAVHFFEVEELRGYLSQTGFRGFKYDVYGSSILFHAEKG